MHTKTCLLYTGTVVNLINFSMLHPSWRDRIKHDDMPKLRKSTKQPMQLDRLISLHFRIGDFSTRMAFGIAKHILLGTLFIDRFIQGIFPVIVKVVPWHLIPAAIITSNWRRKKKSNTKKSIMVIQSLKTRVTEKTRFVSVSLAKSY